MGCKSKAWISPKGAKFSNSKIGLAACLKILGLGQGVDTRTGAGRRENRALGLASQPCALPGGWGRRASSVFLGVASLSLNSAWHIPEAQ